MNHFSLTLSNALRDNGIGRKDFQKALEVGFPAVSKYMNGKALPKPPVLAKIMEQLPAADADEVFSAYLKELFLGTNLASLAESGRKSSMVKEEGDVYGGAKKRKPSSEEEELEYTISLLRELALRKKEVGTMLKALGASLGD